MKERRAQHDSVWLHMCMFLHVVVWTVGVYANVLFNSAHMCLCGWAGKPVWICFVYVCLCLEPYAAWLVGGLIGKALHAWVRSNLLPSVDTQ